MDLALYSALSLGTLIGIGNFNKQGHRIKKKIQDIKETPVFQPSELIKQLNENHHNQSKQFLKLQQSKEIYTGKVFLEGMLNSHFNIQSVIDNQEVLFSTFYTDNIYSNEKYLKRNQIVQNKSMGKNRGQYQQIIHKNIPKKSKPLKNSAPFYQLHDLQNKNISCKVSKNLDTIFIGTLKLISYRQHFNKLNFIDKIFIFIAMIFELLNALSHTNFKYRGIKIGYSEIELGLKPNQIVTLYGEVIYNSFNQELQMTNPQYIVKDKSMIINNLKRKLFYKNTFKYLLFIPLMFSMAMLVKKSKNKIEKIIQKRKDSYLDKLRDFKHLVITDDMRCTICVDNIRNIILKPCKHLCICYKCLNNLIKKECPICKSPIRDHIEIFVS